MKRWAFALSGALLAMSVQAQPPAAVGVVAQQVALKPFHERIEALGTLRANESVEMTANVTETITAIHFEDNQRVEAGFALAEMTSSEEQAQLEEARSTVKEAEQQYERLRPLVKQGNAPRARLDEQKRILDTAKARLDAVQSRLKDRLIIAPFGGVVGLRDISVGALVSPGDVITTLDDDSQMKLDFSVPAVYLQSIMVGLPVKASARAYEGQPFEGTITSIDSRIDPVTRAFQVRAILPNPDFLLKPGMLMQVEILANPREAMVVPEQALEPHGEQQFVYLVQQEGEQGGLIARKTEVKMGARRPGEVEIVSGLEADDRVITDGLIKLTDGAAITLKESAF